MTVVPAGVREVVLICNLCGTEDVAGAPALDEELVWPVLSDRGWSGSPFATGAHRCPACGIAEPDPPLPATPARGPRPGYVLRHDADGIAVIVPAGDLDADLAAELRDDLMRAAALHPHVVMDLSAATCIDSGSLGLLVRARQEARQHGATFDLAAPSRFVVTVLHTMRLDGVFRTFPDVATAVAAIRVQSDPE